MWQVAFVAGGEAVLMAESQFSGIPKDRDALTLLWQWRTGEVATLEDDNPVVGLAVSRHGARFATVEGHVNDDGVEIGAHRIRLWDAAGAVLAETPIDFNAFRIAMAPDGRHLAISGWGGVKLYALPDLAEVRGFGYRGDRQTQQDFSIQNAPTMTGAPTIGFVSGGDILVMGTESGAWLYKISTGDSEILHEGVTRGPLVLAPRGDLIALQGEGVVSVWDMATRKPISRFATPENRLLRFGGVSGRDLFSLRDGAVFRIEWTPEALARRTCALFANGDWRDEARRMLGEEVGEPCPPRPPSPSSAAPIASR